MLKTIKSISFILTCLFLLFTFTPARAWENIDPDPEAVQLINDFLGALSIEDDTERLQAVIPLVHKSLLTRDGDDLDRDTKEFSYKKAYSNVKFYSQPADITEVRKGTPTTVGWEETAEAGRVDKYFIDKKDGVDGMPAPIEVFWPEDGGPPKIYYMGSL